LMRKVSRFSTQVLSSSHPAFTASFLLVGAALLLSGCAAGSPSVVAPAPAAPNTVGAAPMNPAAPVAPALVSPDVEWAVAPTSAPVQNLAVSVTASTAVSESPEAVESVAFVQDSPQTSTAVAKEAPEIATVPPGSAATQSERPPPPPDPGTG